MRDHAGPPEPPETRTKCWERSRGRSGRQAGVNQPPQQRSLPLKPGDASPLIWELMTTVNGPRGPRPAPPMPAPGPPSPSWAQPGSMWPVRTSALFCWLFMGGRFQLNARLPFGKGGVEAEDSRLFSAERRRTTPRLITDALLSEKRNEARGAVDYKWP